MGLAVLGVAPGITGALALYDADGSLDVADMPVSVVEGRRVVDERALARLVGDWAPRIAEVRLAPGAGCYRAGRGEGVLRGVCLAKWLPVVEAKARHADDPRGPASKLFPRHVGLWALKAQEGRAQAALIAWGGRA